MTGPGYGQQPPAGQIPPEVLFQQWAQHRGLQPVQKPSHRVVTQIPGVPWERYPKRSVAFAAWGAHQGLPVLALRVNNRWMDSGSGTQKAGSSMQTSLLCIAVLEVPAPIPTLTTSVRTDAMTNLMSFRTWGKLFEGAGITIEGQAESGRYRVDADNEQFVRWFMTQDVFSMMLPPEQDLPRQHLVADGNFPAHEYLFGLSGRKIVVWSYTNSPRRKANHGVDILDSCIANAFWLYQRIPQQAYNDPSGVEADRTSMPLQELVSRLGK